MNTLPFHYNSSGELVIPEITQENLYLLLPGKVAAVVEMFSKNHNVSHHDALTRFYQSQTYKNLEKESTKFWWMGPVALYEEFVDECHLPR